MWKKFLAASIASVGILAGFCGTDASAAAARYDYNPGEIAPMYSGDVFVCVRKYGGYTGDTITANIINNSYETQINFDSFSGYESCRMVNSIPSGSNIQFVTPMRLGSLVLEQATNDNDGSKYMTLEISGSASADTYLTSYGSFSNHVAASKVEITFNANGGTGTMAPVVDDFTNTITLPTNTLTRTDYAFGGWNTKADGSGTAYADGATLTFTQGGEVELFAQWVARTATLQSGQNVNSKLKTLANGSSAAYYSPDTLIKNLSFVDTLPSTVDENTPKVNIALDGEIPVYAYWVASDETMYINTEANKIYANNDSSNMFYYMQALTSLTLPDSFDTSNVTNMHSMFTYMHALTSLTLPGSFDTSNVTDMREMFAYMYTLTSLTLPDSFNTSKVTDMSWMFIDMHALTSLSLPSSFNTSKVTNMQSMFGKMYALTSLTLPDSFDTSNVTDMRYMFGSMHALTSLTLPDSFNTSNVTDMVNMFAYMQALTSLTLPANFNTSNVTNMSGMFRNMQALISLTLPTSFVISNDTTTTNIFRYIKNTAALYATDATARSLWPGVLGN